eukprot:TRINITY_DN4519_c0_g4_i2.p1 TRINITY_DN4519_c0_g4~~TRINITY_DN4519_c0_g4_i2.p1  ORF type:complete len:516 (-),score=96.62 TRINITY_DN4519_c0_g4_i2:149-1696(-)
MAGGLLAGPLFQEYSTKKIICTNIALNILALIIFPITRNILLLTLSRLIVGFCQVFLVIYFPVWVDRFGGDKKTMWLMYLQLGVPLGVVLGYIMTAVFLSWGFWKGSFYTQLVLLIPCLIAILAFENKYLSTRDEDMGVLQMKQESLDHNSEFLISMSARSSMVFPTRELEDLIVETDEKRDRQASTRIEDEDDDLGNTKLSYFNNLRILWNKKIFVYSMLSISALYFVVTGIQFWISDYFRTELNVSKDTVYLCFSLTSITAPTSGVIFGGVVVSRYGGYTSKYALKICLVFGIIACIFSLPFPMVSNFPLAIVMLWIVFFFGGALMPPATGIMISSIPKPIRAFGSSTAQIFQNLLGYLPAPLVYGMVTKMTRSARTGMAVLMFWSTWGVVGLLLAVRHQDSRLREIKRKNIKDIKNVTSNVDDIRYKDIFDDDENGPKQPRKKKKGKGVVEKLFSSLKEPLIKSREDEQDDGGRIRELNKMYVDVNRFSEGRSLLKSDNLQGWSLMMGKGTK